MGSISFKSVGKTSTQRTDETPDVSPLPIGIKTPIELGTTEGIFKMHYDLSDQIHDNLRNLILLNWGERLGIYAIGANLKPLLSEWTTQENFDAQAVSRISSTVQKYMPYVNLDEFSSTLDTNAKNYTVVNIVITYNVPSLGVAGRRLEVAMQVM